MSVKLMSFETLRVERDEHPIERVTFDRRNSDEHNALLDQLAASFDGLALGGKRLVVPADNYRRRRRIRRFPTGRAEVADKEAHAQWRDTPTALVERSDEVAEPEDASVVLAAMARNRADRCRQAPHLSLAHVRSLKGDRSFP